MAHDGQIPEEDEQVISQQIRDGVCPKCQGTGFPYREEMERGGAFRGVVYSRSSPVPCGCRGER